MSTMGLVGIGEPSSRLTEVRNGLPGRLSLDGVDDSLVERFE
jgi:hypothetical protein